MRKPFHPTAVGRTIVVPLRSYPGGLVSRRADATERGARCARRSADLTGETLLDHQCFAWFDACNAQTGPGGLWCANRKMFAGGP